MRGGATHTHLAQCVHAHHAGAIQPMHGYMTGGTDYGVSSDRRSVTRVVLCLATVINLRTKGPAATVVARRSPPPPALSLHRERARAEVRSFGDHRRARRASGRIAMSANAAKVSASGEI